MAWVFLAILLFWLVASWRMRRTDWGAGWLNLFEGMNRFYCRHFHGLAETTLNLPKSGGAVLVSNHTSGLDAFLLLAASPRPLRFMIAKEEYERFGVTWLLRAVGCIPVDRDNRPDKALWPALERLSEGEVVVLFPHGKIHLDHEPPRKLKRGAAKLACTANVPVVCVRIEGVKGQGSVLGSLFTPSCARINARGVLGCSDSRDQNELLAKIAEAIQPD